MLLATSTFGGKWKPSRCKLLYVSPIYESSYRPSEAVAHVWINSNIFAFTSSFTAAPPYALSRETRLSINSREAISTRKCDPPFFTQVSVSCTSNQYPNQNYWSQ